VASLASLALVWFKRDLRLHDHAPLAQAQQFDATLALALVEPAWLASPECGSQQVAFFLESAVQLREALAARQLALLVRVGEATQVLSELHRQFAFTHLLSHEESGAGWTYSRDRAVAAWCRAHGVQWRETPQTGVVRRLRSRNGWAAQWQRRMDAPVVPAPAGFRTVPGVQTGALPTLRDLGLPAPAQPLPPGGETAAQATLSSFLHDRGRGYRRALSSPLSAPAACSRLSAHLAFGTLSMRQVHQATEARIAALKATKEARALAFAHDLRGFAGRLRWHCHFMQKLEDEPDIEYRNVSRACDGLREDAFDAARLEAWREGRTGFPMVDACMRSLNATGWLNFRMRAMLVSFAAYHLWLHWREPGLHLARQFLDFEPGIHWSQMQMQSGTTGINTLRIYSPAKQAADHDPQGEFVSRWVPEIGTAAYPRPIVDERQALTAAKQRLYALRSTEVARSEAQAIQDKHGSRKSGLPPTTRRRGPQRNARQQELFE
jgi:deoxyribodipyrimidine photo-lyase